MNGRMESEEKKFRVVDNKLKDYPPYVSTWYLNLRASDCSAKTCYDYVSKVGKYLASINENIAKVQIKDLTYPTVSRYYISIKTKRDAEGNLMATSDSYQQTVWCCLNNFFRFLKSQHLIEENPMEMIKKPKNKDLDRINENRIRLDKDNFREILKAVDGGAGSHSARLHQEKMKERDLAIMLIFMTTGIRVSALLNINIGDVDLDDGTLSVIDKGAKWRKCKLTDDTVRHIKNWLRVRDQFLNGNETDSLFLSYQGNRMCSQAVTKLVDKYCEEALGFHVSPHKLRSGFCSIMYKETKDIEKVRRMVGHSDISTTQRYIVTDGSERDEAAQIMTEILG